MVDIPGVARRWKRRVEGGAADREFPGCQFAQQDRASLLEQPGPPEPDHYAAVMALWPPQEVVVVAADRRAQAEGPARQVPQHQAFIDRIAEKTQALSFSLNKPTLVLTFCLS